MRGNFPVDVNSFSVELLKGAKTNKKRKRNLKNEYVTVEVIAHSEAATTPIEQDEKVFEVNPKQYLRILERRKARNVLKKRYAEAAKTPYMHESRHKHAQKRPRSSTGRFLTKKEIEELKKKQADKGNGVFGVRQKRKRDDTESKVSSA